MLGRHVDISIMNCSSGPEMDPSELPFYAPIKLVAWITYHYLAYAAYQSGTVI